MRNENPIIEKLNSYRKKGKLPVDLLLRNVLDDQRRMLVFVFKDGWLEGLPCHGDFAAFTEHLEEAYKYIKSRGKIRDQEDIGNPG